MTKEVVLIDLGWAVGRLLKNGSSEELHLVGPSVSNEGMYQPAESITIYFKNNIIALRDALNKAYPPE